MAKRSSRLRSSRVSLDSEQGVHMTATTDQVDASRPPTPAANAPSPKHGLSTLQKSLIGVVVVYFGMVPFFWWLEEHVGVSHGVATNTMTLLQVLCFVTALSLPWFRLSGQRD